MRITVFTPLYNRGYCIKRLYQSLQGQTFQDFEWIVINDGSTDDSDAVMKDICKENHTLSIQYLKTQNGGKHRAINKGVCLAKGELFYIVDSDDVLPLDALAIIDQVASTLDPQVPKAFAGVCGLKTYFSGKLVGTTFAEEFCDTNTILQSKQGISGDKAYVVYTSLLQKYPFPAFENENFCTESIVFDRIAMDGYVFRFFNQAVYQCEYLEDGLTAQGLKLYANNPKQWGLSIAQDYQYHKINAYEYRIALYKYYLWERKSLTLKQMATYTKSSPFVILQAIFLQTVLNVYRKMRGKPCLCKEKEELV